MTSAVQAEQSKSTITLPSYQFFYSREAVFLLTNFCTPKAHVSVSHTQTRHLLLLSLSCHLHLLSPSCHLHLLSSSCHPPVALMSPAPAVIFLSPAPTPLLLSSSCRPLVTLLSLSCNPPVTLLSPQEGRQYWLTRFVAHTLEWLLAVYKMVEAHAADGKYAVPMATHTHHISGTGCRGTIVQGTPTSVTHSTSLPKAYIVLHAYMYKYSLVRCGLLHISQGMKHHSLVCTCVELYNGASTQWLRYIYTSRHVCTWLWEL